MHWNKYSFLLLGNSNLNYSLFLQVLTQP